ncbi:MAG: imidazole glycerol phosphate synthase subunit HisH [Pseudomonadota bacterium]|nr:imidazole glycerol phosphate synthase subunit HisH [Pseudomonadota bacterium]
MKIAIIDCGSGNLRSAAKAFERAAAGGGEVRVTGEPLDLKRATHIVLPGVGAFADCRSSVATVPGMAEALEAAVISEAKPFLGICVGMQLMADRGLEHETTEGFGWISGEVHRITPSESTLKIPHIGWNNLHILATEHPLFADIREGAHAYFVHSYGFECTAAANRLATADYGGSVTAAIGRDNMVGTQFHPEKSQSVGLRLIANFLKWRP